MYSRQSKFLSVNYWLAFTMCRAVLNFRLTFVGYDTAGGFGFR